MEAVPPLVFCVGVKVALRVVPESVRFARVPPRTERSAEEKDSPGSSEKVKEMVAVSPILKDDLLLVIARVGAMVSTVRER
jgi:hypothetical protein